jgi:hypothetical protein
MLDIELTTEQVQFDKTLPKLENSRRIDATLTHNGVHLTAYGFKTAPADVLVESGSDGLTIRDIPGTAGLTGSALRNLLRDTAKLQEFDLYKFWSARPLVSGWKISTNGDVLKFLLHMGAETTCFQVTPTSDMECRIVLRHGGEELWHRRMPVRFPQDLGEVYRMAQAIDVLCLSAKH